MPGDSFQPLALSNRSWVRRGCGNIRNNSRLSAGLCAGWLIGTVLGVIVGFGIGLSTLARGHIGLLESYFDQQVDVDGDMLGLNKPADVAILADARRFLELLGDELERLATFDPDTQRRTGEELDLLTLYPRYEAERGSGEPLLQAVASKAPLTQEPEDDLAFHLAILRATGRTKKGIGLVSMRSKISLSSSGGIAEPSAKCSQ